jgi:hypothetical protein
VIVIYLFWGRSEALSRVSVECPSDRDVEKYKTGNQSALPLLIIDDVLWLSDSSLLHLTKMVKELSYVSAIMKIVLVASQDRLDSLKLLKTQRLRTPVQVSWLFFSCPVSFRLLFFLSVLVLTSFCVLFDSFSSLF